MPSLGLCYYSFVACQDKIVFYIKISRAYAVLSFFHCIGHKNPFSHQKSTRDLGPGEGGKEPSAAESGGK